MTKPETEWVSIPRAVAEYYADREQYHSREWQDRGGNTHIVGPSVDSGKKMRESLAALPETPEDRARMKALEIYELLENLVMFIEVYALEHNQPDLIKSPWFIVAASTVREIRDGTTPA